MFKKKEKLNYIDLIKMDIQKTVKEIEIIENNMNYVSGKEFDVLVYKLNALRIQLSILVDKAKKEYNCI